MTRVSRPPRRMFVAVASGWILLGLILLTQGAAKTLGAQVFFALFGLLVGVMTLALFVNRATITDTTLHLRSLRPGRNLRVALEDVVRYAPDSRGTWWVETAGRRVPLPVAEPWAIHAGMAEFAPHKLSAKRLRPQHLPPDEEFHNLWTYDVEALLSETIGRIVAIVVLVALTRRTGAAYGLLVAPLFFGLFEMVTRLDVTNEGLVRRGPFHRRTIPWNEATAVFCEKGFSQRAFVITSREAAIEIPNHLAQDVDLMQKAFRSLPDDTLLVNFDESTFRGYRRRKKALAKTPRTESLTPLLTD